MTDNRRSIRPALLVGGWGLVAGAVVGEITDGAVAAFGSFGAFAVLLVGMSGLALACLGASVDADPIVLDRRLVGFSSGQRQLLRFAGVALGLGIPAGVAVSIVGGGLIGAALTLTAVVVGLSLVSAVCWRAARYALRDGAASSGDGEADAK